ncbi:hypothetical protein [Paracoccus aminophilus]|uniref:hypothetical protein n=1 Tax=Paracoccus aminophilus TaxID=34003 RepID=UPI0005A2FF2A|nr:hypothetical protein [Paracoccus aminophilus]
MIAVVPKKFSKSFMFFSARGKPVFTCGLEDAALRKSSLILTRIAAFGDARASALFAFSDPG